MNRWLMIGFGILLLLTLFVLWSSVIDEPPLFSSFEPDRFDTRVENKEKAVSPPQESKPQKKPMGSMTVPAAQTSKSEPPDNTKPVVDPKTLNYPLAPPMESGPLDILKPAYENESSDATSTAYEHELRALFGNEQLPEEVLYSVSCHRTVCKLKMRWSIRHPVIHIALAFLINQKRQTYMAFDPETEPDKNGNVTFDVYVNRAGYTLDDLQ